MAELTKQALKVENNTEFPNNNNGAITPSNLRGFNVNMIDSLVDEIGYNVDSASWNQAIDSLETNSGSVNISITDLNASSASQQISIDALNVFTSSVVGLSTGSLLVTASASGNTLTFTKGDASQFNVVVATGSIPDITALNQATASLQAYTSSANIRFANLESTTASLNVSVSNINTFTQSVGISITNLNVSSASQQVSIDSLNAATSSYVTSAITASSLITASFDNGNRNLTFTKGDSTTFSVNIPDVSGSAGDFVTTASFNAYTSSTNQRVSSLETNSASVNISVSALNTFTASQSTASLVTSINNLNSFSASTLVSITNLNSATASYARTDVNNNFSGTQIFNNIAVNGTASIAYLESVTGSAKIIGDAFIILNNDTPAERYAGIIVIDSGSANTTASFQYDGLNSDWFFEKDVSGSTEFGVALFGPEYTTLGSPIYNANNRLVKGNGGHHLDDSNISDDGSIVSINSNTQITGSLGLIGNQTITGSLLITGSQILIGELTSSRLRVNSSTSLGGTLSVAFDTIMRGDLTVESTSPQIKLRDNGAGGFSSGYDIRVDTGSFEIYDDTHNRDVLSDFFDSASASHTTSLTSEKIVISGSTSVTILGPLTASLQNGHVFVGNVGGVTSQVPTSSIQSDVSGLITTASFNTYTSSTDVRLTNIESTTASLNTSVASLNTFTASQSTASIVNSITELNTFSASTLISLTNINSTTASQQVSIDALNINSGSVNISIGALNTFTQSAAISIINLNSATASYATTGSNTFIGNQIITGSLNIQNTITASLQQGFVLVGNAAGRTTTVATSSFGGAVFPFVGDAQISGSLGVTGSVSGLVNTLTIAASTASMNFNNGNFFRLQLVSGSITHLTATNIRAGQTINLLVLTDSGSAAASGSLAFSPTFKFAGGFDYTPTAVTASQDLVSFVTFDTTQILAAQIKNLL